MISAISILNGKALVRSTNVKEVSWFRGNSTFDRPFHRLRHEKSRAFQLRPSDSRSAISHTRTLLSLTELYPAPQAKSSQIHTRVFSL